MPQKRMECFRLLLEHLAWIEHQFLSGIRDSRKAVTLWGMMRGVRKSIYQSWLAKYRISWISNTMLRFEESSGRDSVGRGQHSSNRVSGISSRTIHQSTTPSLSQPIWLRWTSRQFVTLLIVETLLPVTFVYSLSSRKTLEAIVMRQLRRWKRLWRRSLICSHNRTSALQLEEITSKGTRVSYVYYQ